MLLLSCSATLPVQHIQCSGEIEIYLLRRLQFSYAVEEPWESRLLPNFKAVDLVLACESIANVVEPVEQAVPGIWIDLEGTDQFVLRIFDLLVTKIDLDRPLGKGFGVDELERVSVVEGNGQEPIFAGVVEENGCE